MFLSVPPLCPHAVPCHIPPRPADGMIRRIVSAVLWWTSCLVLQASTPSYFTHAWQTEDGVPGNNVTAIVQTRDGYLWVGTRSGLARFDGAHFTTFDSANAP